MTSAAARAFSSRRSARRTCLPTPTRRAIAWPIWPGPTTTTTSLAVMVERSGAVSPIDRSSIDHALSALRVPRAVHRDVRRGGLDLAQIVLRERDVGSAEILLEAMQLRRAGDG